MTLFIEVNNSYITNMGTTATIDFYNTISINRFTLDNINIAITGGGSPFLNVVIDNSNGHSLDTKVHIPEVIDFFEDEGVPWAWFISEATSADYLLTHGFTFLEKFPNMYFDLSTKIPIVNNTKAIVIKEVLADSSLSEWIKPINECFVTPEDEEQSVLYQSLMKSDVQKLRHFNAYFNDQLAGSSTLFLSGNTATLYNIAVKPSLQRKGIGQNLTLHMMYLAQCLGFQHCFLDSSEQGYNLYKQIGFKTYNITNAYQKSYDDMPI